MNSPNFIEVTTVSFEIFGINWLNCAIDITLPVYVFAIAELTVKYFLILMLMLLHSTELIVELTIPSFLLFMQLAGWFME